METKEIVAWMGVNHYVDCALLQRLKANNAAAMTEHAAIIRKAKVGEAVYCSHCFKV